MALSADRRVMPPADLAPDGEPPDRMAAPNLFAPISTANRITGQSRQSRLHTREQHMREQLATGSSYDYGRSTDDFLASIPAFSADAYTLGFERVPPTFLRRTMLDAAEASVAPSPFGYGLAHMAAPEALQEAYAAGGRPDFAAHAAGFDEPPEATVFQSGVPLPDTAVAGARFAAPRGARTAGLARAADDAPVSEGPSAYDDLTSQSDGMYPSDQGEERPARRARAPRVSPAAPEAPFYASFAQTEATSGMYVAPPVRPTPDAPPHASFAQADMPPAPRGAARGYVPRHGGRGSAERGLAEPVAAVPAPQASTANADVWQMLGWKETDPASFEQTAVWRVNELSMFESAAFDETLDPLRRPPEAMPGLGPAYPQNAPAAVPAPPSGFTAPFTPAPPEDGYAGYPPAGLDSQGYPAAAPEDWQDGGAYAPRGDTPPPARPPRPVREAPEPAPREGRVRGTLGRMTPARLALYVAVSLALLFCLIEGLKIVRSLSEDDRAPSGFADEYGQPADGGQPANGVELLPAGVTYAPTATPIAVATPTPTPRISQYDPLIGVMDSGGAQPSANLPTPTPAVRTRLSKYPGNALLSVSAAFEAQRKENPDVVARLTIDGLLDETVVQRNNTFYLNHNARGLLGTTGAVFVDEGCQLKKPPENLLLRAQANTEGKLFAPLLAYENGGGAFVAQHGIVRCDTIYEEAQYVIFAILRADSVINTDAYFNFAAYPTFASDTQMMNYVNAARERSVIRIDVNVQPGDRLLTLATVAEGSDTTSLVILCRMLRSGESAAYIDHN